MAIKEGIDSSNIYMVGNILMDTLRFYHTRNMRPALLSTLNIRANNYVLFTLNRKALIRNAQKIDEIMTELSAIATQMPVIAPLRTEAKNAIEAWIDANPTAPKITLIEPLSYTEFIYLAENAKGVVTDSGNVAEEATFNGIPCITLNDYTEHIETVKVGSNVLVGNDVDLLKTSLQNMIKGEWKSCAIPDRWDGRSADRIVSILLEQMQ